jgi:phycocyanobilin:ferredoxin oxidoreductase
MTSDIERSQSFRSQLHPLIHQLADRIEAHWQNYLELSPYPIPKDLGYVEGKLEGEKLVIENRCCQSSQFRKLHLELARVGNNLDILHCVMFPRPDYDLPMFGTDLVGSARAGISAAIVDLSPLRGDRTLPAAYTRALAQEQPYQFLQPRELPAWGDIFSEFCLFVRPSDPQEENQFLAQADRYLETHCRLAAAATPDPSQAAARLHQQQYYCQQQQQNDKTRRILEKSFGSSWAEYYMSQMLFDLPD